MGFTKLAVCHECRSVLGRIRSPRSAPKWLNTRAIRTQTRALEDHTHHQLMPPSRHATVESSSPMRFRYSTRSFGTSRVLRDATEAGLGAVHARIQELSDTVLKSTDEPVPSEQRVLYVLEQLEALGHTLSDEQASHQVNSQPAKKGTTATSALLGSVNAKQHSSDLDKSGLLSLISAKAEDIVRHPNVFITAAVLKSYIGLQTSLHQPSSFPDIFYLYAWKSTPRAVNGTVEYAPAKPNKINMAINSQTANAALSLAMDVQSLPLCIDIINTTFCTPAYKKAKILRQGFVPIAGLTLAPLAAYTISRQFAHFQTTMDPDYASGLAFAGIMTYFGAVSMIGYVAVTTANDQMDRITWAQGVPLWERWVREEERAALDRVAGKWGFADTDKRGEEEGQDWETLREFVGIRGMVLDKVELMEGME